jgi:GNAT superfamily N-acetyltransferase
MPANIRTTIGELGLFGTCLYAANRITEKLFDKRLFYDYAIVVQPISPGRERRNNPYVTHVYDSAESADFLVERFPAPRSVVLSRFRQGAVCVALEKAGEYVACAWLALDGYMEDEVRCRFVPLPADETGWDFDVYVDPDCRGTMVFLRIWQAVSNYYAERGRRWSLSRISNFNRASLHAHQSMGATIIGRAVFCSVGPWQLAFSTMRPRLHFGLSKSRYPTFELDVT